METIRLSSSLFTLSTTRTLRFLGLTARSKIKATTIPRSGHISVVRSLSSDSAGGTVSARPSSELKKKNKDPDEEVEDAKLQALRETFFRPAVGIDAYIIPSEDAHQSEFIAERFMRRAYVSGFTGSAGTAVVTKKSASLWTDGRYFLQAEKQLGKGWGLMRSGTPGVPTTAEWLNQVLDPGCRVGIDPFLFSSDAAEELKNVISQKNHELVYLYDVNLVDEIWKGSQPKPPSEPIRVHPIEYAGVDVSSKLSSLRIELANAGCTAIVISMLDEIAWLLNLRGNDIPNSPVFYAYLIVNNNGAKLFVDTCKVTPEVMLHLKSAGVKLQSYESIISEIESLSVKGERLWMDKSSVNSAIANAFKSASEKHHLDMQYAALCRASPITMSKAIKSHAELVGMCNSHLRDAAALAYFWAWLEDQIHNSVKITEVDVADRLLEFRSKQSGFVDTSFDTISGYGANGAIIHYRPYPESCSVVDDKNLFLLDSGAQYVDGTTDITRTVHFGEPTKRQKECFTRVLQGHIALDMAVFPENTPGFVLDVLARSSLWKIGLDYRHGTGHGVGAALNVHEGPHSISFRFGNLTPLQEGMIVSNEPGYYEDHSFGIRTENLVYIKEASTPNRYGGMKYLGFEKLTFVPIQTKLIDLSLLSTTEIAWLDDYHSQVWEKVSPLVDGPAVEWLWNSTRPLPKQSS